MGEAMDMSISIDRKCRGRPMSGWGGLGKSLGRTDCQQKCLEDTSCLFAVYRPKNGACSSFASCEGPVFAPGFIVLSRQTILIDFEASLTSMAESCSTTHEQPAFKILGCRGTDSRCANYKAPDVQNGPPCKALARQGADCTWAKENPTGFCTGQDSRCGQDRYKTHRSCKKLQRSGASCTWRKNQLSFQLAPSPEEM